MLVFKSKSKSKRKTKTSKQLERHFKGVANHWRLEILFVIAEKDGITVEKIAEILEGNFKTISEHLRRLAHSGLIIKKYRGREVEHRLSPYGQIFFEFIKTFSHS